HLEIVKTTTSRSYTEALILGCFEACRHLQHSDAPVISVEFPLFFLILLQEAKALTSLQEIMNLSVFIALIVHVAGMAHCFQTSRDTSDCRSKSINTILYARPQTRSSEVHKNILSRRTTNDFEPTLPTNWEKALERAINAAIYAPNHKRTEPWRFYLLGPKSIESVCQINAGIVSATKGVEAGDKKMKRWLQMPGWLVVTCVKVQNGPQVMDDPMSLAREDYAACCCAIQNLCLSLHSQGIATKWTTGAVNFDERFAEAVGFCRDKEYTVGTIWFGKAVQKPQPPAKKLGLKDVLRKVD
ncbi:hypothetical protein ACHAW6_007995, partial [Cyclotella cf. meneghiniana]